MITFLNNNEIDRKLWDNCIQNIPFAKPYSYSWYLDIMAPGWQALVDDDYDSVFPIPGFSRFRIQYIATPVFLQQLGAFSPDKRVDKAIAEFIDYMPEFYKLIDLCIGQKLDNPEFQVYEKVNFELDLTKSYDTIYNNFTDHCKRNIDASARKRMEFVSDITADELIDLFKENKGKEITGIKSGDYLRLKNLINFCIVNRKGRVIGVRGNRQKLIFGIFLVEVTGNKTILFVVNTSLSREKRIGYSLVNELIRYSSSTKTILDFAGSSIPTVASFMQSFGCTGVPYYRIYRNRLFWPLRMFK